MSSRDVLPPGTMLDGKYRIDRLIGAGGFGMTYEAHDIGLNMRVAVKEYYPAHFGTRDGTLTVRPRTTTDAELFQRLKESFLREARTLAQLRHPCVVRVLSVFEGHGTAYMIMEYESGQSFKGWLERLGRKPTQQELDRIVMPLLDALEIIHAEGFLHRDIAPDNIIVRADGTPVLLDFGAARRVMAELSGALTGIVKSGYSPQEQYTNDPRAQGPWSDIYALGATLYRAIAGKTPEEATIRMLEDPVLPAVQIGAGQYRTGFLAAIDRAMKVRPKERQQSIDELRRELKGDGATRTLAPRVPASASVETVALAETRTGGWDRIPSAATAGGGGGAQRTWFIAVAAALALLVAGGGWFAYTNRADQSAQVALAEAERQRQVKQAAVKAEADRIQRETERVQREAERLRQEAELQKRVPDEQDRIAAEAERRRLAAEAERLKRQALEQQQQGTGLQPAAGSLAARLEDVLGPCPFCDDVRKLVRPEEFQQLTQMTSVIDRTISEVIGRRGPREDAKARSYLELLAKVALEADPVAAIKAGNARCTTYHYGFLDNAAERVGQHQCVVRMVLIGGELTSLTVEKTTGDGFHANLKRFRVNAMAYLGRTYLKGHQITRYNQAVPKNRENDNFGNKVGLLISLNGVPALVSINQNGFTEPDPTFFEIMVIEP